MNPSEPTFPGTGEMSRRLRAYPWAEADMDEPPRWPSVLRAAVRICLTSRFPMIVWWGPDLRFLYNDAYLPLLGANHPALGKPGRLVWDEIWHIIGPMLDSVVATGEATWSEDLLLPMHRHGYLEETYWTYSYSPLHDDEGVVRGVFTAVSDTTERVVGERRLAVLRDLGALAGRARTVDEACRSVVDTLAHAGMDVPFAAVHLPDPESGGLVPVAAGPAPFTGSPDGWPSAEVVRTGRPAVVDDLAARFGPLPAGGWAAPPTQAVVLPLTGDDGRPIGAVVLGAGPGRMLDEAHTAFLGLVAQQIAALVNATVAYQAQQRRVEQLAELDRAKTTFFSNISHEFRTPLALILGPTEELRSGPAADDPAVREELEVIHRNGLRLGKLVTALLDFSRIEAGRMRARYEPVDLARYTAELAGVFRSAVEKAGLAFEVDCPPLAEPVHVDRGMWEKVVFNLLSNAVKYTFDGSVRVVVRAEDRHAVVTVADTGVGIAAAEIPRLFERFHRIETARSRSNEGSGIGLALVRELVLLHGGGITAESTEDVGTVFTVRLPFGSAHLPAELVHAEAGPVGVSATADPFLQEALRWLPEDVPGAPPVVAHRPDTGVRVLVADDNADMREYLERLLVPFYAVQAVPDGLAALEAVRAAPPDLVVSDVMMPRLDGLHLVAALRADPATAGVPVLLLSARAGQEASIEGLAAGADDYLVKPFAAAELLARVRANVELARLRNRHVRWRTAITQSLQEAFFVCDETGAVVEINAAFTRMLGHGPEGLPYRSPLPWLPDGDADPEARRLAVEAFDRVAGGEGGHCTAPVTDRSGRRRWIALSFSRVEDPDTHRRVVVGTFRDVTAEHHGVRRDTALSAVGVRLAAADDPAEALAGTIAELRLIWQARRVLGIVVGTDDSVTSTDGDVTEADLPSAIADLRTAPLLTPVDRGDEGVGIALDHPEGRLVLWVEPDGRRPFAPEDRMLLALLAGHVGQALHRIHRGEQQRKAALALQHAILGPALPGGFAVRYEPATRPLEVGGDWYDTVGLPDGRLGIVVGDCVGHGLDAAAVMGQLRSACRALLLQDSGPARTLMAMDVFAATLRGARCTTVFCGVLDPETGALTYSSAGHPPGIVVRPDGTRALLDGGRSLPLGVRPGRERPEVTTTVSARSTVLLYTDGLVERRGQDLADGIAEAGRAVAEEHALPTDDLATALMARLAPADGYSDDVALLLYRHPGPLEVGFPAEPGHLARVRARLRDWLARCAVPTEQAQSVLVAVGEACANAVEHGHRDVAGTVVLSAAATAADLLVTVADGGTWKRPDENANPHRGRGLPLIRALTDDVRITSDATGTTVELRTRITTP
ncbi:SpoIIE family protein phosphatase [Saccharothrix violaceirubra]|uniref:histidine kinase n=1 Tax=Saccharothrix violaceirubra TaxID=413306 RepID=A0A7W7T379_9PSEU|nr:SpoIIE family protein phosphatase [Saccharothrix violaceirubra]MBB4965724.1 PAS domain S-box-containing protein [Saccharothrix violaceirubra]